MARRRKGSAENDRPAAPARADVPDRKGRAHVSARPGGGAAVICFDLAETLVSWKDAYEAALREAMREWTARLGDEAEAARRVEDALRAYRHERKKGKAKSAAVRAAAAALQGVDDERTARMLALAARKLQPSRARLAPGAEAALRALSGRYRLAIVTNTDAATAKELWSRLGLGRYIRESDIFTAENGLKKPQKRFFRAVAEKLGAAGSRCVMVGDSYRRDVAGALRAGWRAVWLCGGAAGGAAGKPRLKKASPSAAASSRLRVAASLDELPRLFR